MRFDNLHVEFQADGCATLWLDVAGRSSNVFHRRALEDLEAVLDGLSARTGLRLLVVRSAKSNGFAAGADLHEFPALRRPEEAIAFSAIGQRLFGRLERLPVTTVAVIEGPCLGGGLELALACDYRLAVQHPQTQLGLPEVQLGLVPGWGGTQRLPRVIGLEQALPMLLQGRRLQAGQARACGLVDALAPGETEVAAALGELLETALRQGKQLKKHLPLRGWRQRLLDSTAAGRWLLFGLAGRALRQRVPEQMPAPGEVLEAVRVGLARGVTAGLAREREAIGRLAATSACRNLVRLFLQHEEAGRLPLQARDPVPAVRRIGVVGAGTLGAGIAQLAALKGFQVIIQQPTEASLSRGWQRVEDLFARAVRGGRLTPETASARLASIARTTTWQGFDTVDLVVESVPEDLETKRAVFRELERHTRPTTLLATNTSSLRVGELQQGLKFPGQLAGLHFFHPVHRIPLVEVVPTPATTPTTLAGLVQWAVALGKTPLVAQDVPGFVVNRILMPYVNEALLLLAEGMPIARIDAGMRHFGMPLGPLELLDLSGLDVAAQIAGVMRQELAGRFAPNTAFDRMCERGWRGAKSGAGFYRYRGKAKWPHAAAQALLRQPGPSLADLSAAEQQREARARLVGLMVNEAAACLGRGTLTRARDVDLAMVLGTGWAPHRGGPLRHADEQGLAGLCDELEKLAQRLGPRFEPCPELRRRARAGEPFHDGDPEMTTGPAEVRPQVFVCNPSADGRSMR